MIAVMCHFGLTIKVSRLNQYKWIVLSNIVVYVYMLLTPYNIILDDISLDLNRNHTLHLWKVEKGENCYCFGQRNVVHYRLKIIILGMCLMVKYRTCWFVIEHNKIDDNSI